MTEPRTLYLAWQDPEERVWYSVGEVTFEAETELYRFRYLRGAENARDSAGFRGVARLGDFGVEYTSSELFPFLKNRVFPRGREGYADYQRRLGLEPDGAGHSVNAFDILTRSNGRRATDRFEVFAPPHRSGDLAEFTFFTRGLRYRPEPVRERWKNETSKGPYRLLLDPMNGHDPWAVIVCDAGNGDMGYVPAYYSGTVYKLAAQHRVESVRLICHNPSPAPEQERFLISVQAHVDRRWSFPSSEDFEPLPVDATIAA